MASIKLEQFGGMLPAWDDHLLPPGQASALTDGYMVGGNLIGWRKPKLLRALLNTSAKYVYRVPIIPPGLEPTFDNNILENSVWLEFLDQDTKVVKSQINQDVYGRFYSASPSVGPSYNTTARIVNGQPFFTLGVPAPGCNPAVTVTGGGNTVTLDTFNNNNGADGNQDTLLANTVYLIPVIPNGATQLQDVQFFPETGNTSIRYSAVLYGDANPGGTTYSTPGALLATGEVLTGITGGAAVTAPFPNPPGLSMNTPYWIGIITDQDIIIAEGSGGSNSFAFVDTFTNGPALTAPKVGQGGFPGQIDLQMWGDGTSDDVIEPRAYVYTWVSAYGEEGPPSPPTTVNGWSNGTWTIGLFCPDLSMQGVSRNLAEIRLYRTVPGTNGQTTYFFVTNVSIGSTDPDAVAFCANDPLGCNPPAAQWVDTVLDNVIALNIQLPSTNWFPPPVDLKGLINLPNGMTCGWRNNEIWFCEPYRPHAWPAGYVITTDYPIVGMAGTLGAVVAATTAYAYVANGTSPATMSLTRCAIPQPCTSQGSILGTDAGVYYHSPNGMIFVSPQGQLTNTTELWVTREKWAKLTPQKYSRCVPMAGYYYSFGSTFHGDNTYAQQGYAIQMEQDNMSFTIWPQPGGHRVGFEQLSAPNASPVDNLLIDAWTGIILLVQNANVYYYDFTDPAPALQPYTFRSKKFQQTTKKNFEAMRVFFTVPPNTPDPTTVPRNEAPKSDPSWQTLSPTQYGIVRVYADVDDGSGDGTMQLVTCREIRRNGELLRIESGFKAENWQFEFTGRVNISNMQIATSAKELARV